MHLKYFLILIIVIIAVSHIHATDTGDWDEITVNKVTFKIPMKYSNGTISKSGNGYSQGETRFFHINSLVQYKNLKNIYGFISTSDGIIDIEERQIAGHDAVIIYNHNDVYDYDYLDVFFTTGNKIFRIQYPSYNVTYELKQIIKSTSKSKISKEKFHAKLDDAQREYLEDERQESLELDLEDYYRMYNDENKHQSFYYFGSNGYGFGGSYGW